MSATGYHGPGDLTDQHNFDPAAHGGLFVTKAGTAPDVATPALIVPPSTLLGSTPASAVWPAANSVFYQRFHLPMRAAYRWVNLRVMTQSGNIQVGVVSLRRSGTTMFGTRVMDSTVIACPAAGDQRIDCGATTLPSGDYALFLWCDNTTAAFLSAAASGITATRLLWTQTGLTTGVGSAEGGYATTTRWVNGISLESDS